MNLPLDRIFRKSEALGRKAAQRLLDPLRF